ncbi:hypothetical protein SLE2022_292840 [Rubroshorea leprosula]
MPNSLELALLVSKPPDIRNWFGSYVYESPVLDTSDDFKSSANHKTGCEKDAFVIRDSFKEKVENAEKMTIDPYVRSWTLIIHHLAFLLLLRQYSSDKLFSGWNQILSTSCSLAARRHWENARAEL